MILNGVMKNDLLDAGAKMEIKEKTYNYINSVIDANMIKV